MATSTSPRLIKLSIILTTGNDRLQHDMAVPGSGSIQGLKEVLYMVLSGRPHPSGQILVHMGRILENSEIIEDICNEPTVDTNIFHIVVSPQSWAEKPPVMPTSQFLVNPNTLPHPHQLVPQTELRRVDTRNERTPFLYFHWLHYNALRALLGHPPYIIAVSHGRPMDAHKQDAINFFTWSAVKWPAAFDREQELYTTPRRPGQGLEYVDMLSSLRPVLKLQPNSAPPTDLQKLALEILTYTFPLLAVDITQNQLESMNPRQRQWKLKLEAHVQALQHALANGLPLPPQPNLEDRPVVAGPQINRRFVIRIGVETILLLFRAALAYWFLRPFNRTFTGVLYVGWLLYEFWQLWTRPDPLAPAQGQQQQQRAGGGAAGPAGAAPNAPAGPNAPGAPILAANGRAAPAGNGAVEPVVPVNRTRLEQYARFGFEREAEAAVGRPDPENQERRIYRPLRWIHRIWMFIVMLVLSVYPKYWEVRQQALRERERELRVLYGPLREDGEEAPAGPNNAIENGEPKEKAEPPPQVPPPPAGWVGDYVNRARRAAL